VRLGGELTLGTERCDLRPVASADVPGLFALFSDPDVVRYWSAPAWATPVEAEELVDRERAGLAEGTSVRLAVLRRMDGALIGTYSIFALDAQNRRAELGYALTPSVWGQGYATEAGQAVVRHTFESVGLHRLEADVDPRNEASTRVLTRLGFRLEGLLRDRWIVAGETSDSALQPARHRPRPPEMTARGPSARRPPQPWPHEPVLAWAAERLSANGRRIVQAQVVRAHPWATTVRLTVALHRSVGSRSPGEVPTATVFAKTASPPFGYEMRLLAVLGALTPDAAPVVLDLDPERGFALLEDGGPTLTADAPVASWSRVLEHYAGIQRALIEHESTLLAAGLPDLRPTAAAASFAALTERPDALVVGGPHGVSGDEARAVRALVPRMRAVAARLETAGMPATVQHDDLQPGNALLDGRLIDWGDASLAHPFASLLTALHPAMDRPGTAEERDAVRDAYLAAFVGRPLDAAELAEVREQARLACLLAPAGRILTWLRVPEALAVYPSALAEWWRLVPAMDWRVD